MTREKNFDCVEMMRSIRDELSKRMKDMTLEQQLAWLASQDLGDAFLEHLRDKQVQVEKAPLRLDIIPSLK